jgi:valine--pyruvate aminotransferase
MPSSQSACFLLFNLLAGQTGSSKRRILFPLLPEYIGYANQSLTEGQFTACLPRIVETAPHEIKYHVDFDRLRITPDVAAMCVSCPTNPTGNVLTQNEFDSLYAPKWQPGMIFSISMSKVGLPGVRTAMIVADPHIVKALSNMNAIVSLANGNLGQALLMPLLKDDTLIKLGPEVIRPFYRERSDFAKSVLASALGDRVPWALHAQEGAFFLWLWINGLPIPAKELYRRLKERKVLVIPGHYFAYGIDQEWRHPHECLRLTYSQPQHIVREGLEIIADEIIRSF